MLDVIIKDKVFRFIGFYGSNVTSELPGIFRLIKSFVTSSDSFNG